MCEKKENKKNLLLGLKMRYKVLLVSSLLLLLGLSSLAAWPIKQAKKEVKPTQAVSSQEQIVSKVIAEAAPSSQPLSETLQVTSTDNKQNLQNGLTEQVAELQKKLDTSVLIKDDIKQDIAEFKADFEAYKALEKAEDNLAEVTLDALSKLEQQNVKQADSIADLAASLKKEQGTKAILKLNGILGFKDNLPILGAGASIGIRFGKGFIVECGANYMLGHSVKDIIDFKLDNLQIITSLGWEF